MSDPLTPEREHCLKLEAEGKYRTAASRWLELADLLVLNERWDDATDAANNAAECAHRLGLRLFTSRKAEP